MIMSRVDIEAARRSKEFAVLKKHFGSDDAIYRNLVDGIVMPRADHHDYYTAKLLGLLPASLGGAG